MSDKAVESGRDHWQWVMVSYNTKCQKNNLHIILGRVNEETMVQSENKLRVQWSKNCVWRQCNANTKLAVLHPFEIEGSLQSNCKIWLHLLNKECYQQDKRKAEKKAQVCTVGSHLYKWAEQRLCICTVPFKYLGIILYKGHIIFHICTYNAESNDLVVQPIMPAHKFPFPSEWRCLLNYIHLYISALCNRFLLVTHLTGAWKQYKDTVNMVMGFRTKSIQSDPIGVQQKHFFIFFFSLACRIRSLCSVTCQFWQGSNLICKCNNLSFESNKVLSSPFRIGQMSQNFITLMFSILLSVSRLYSLPTLECGTIILYPFSSVVFWEVTFGCLQFSSFCLRLLLSVLEIFLDQPSFLVVWVLKPGFNILAHIYVSNKKKKKPSGTDEH